MNGVLRCVHMCASMEGCRALFLHTELKLIRHPCMPLRFCTLCTHQRMPWRAGACVQQPDLLCFACVAASCSGPVTVTNGNFSCGTTLSGLTCAGACNSGYSGAPVATCTNGVYTVSGSCQPGEEARVLSLRNICALAHPCTRHALQLMQDTRRQFCVPVLATHCLCAVG